MGTYTFALPVGRILKKQFGCRLVYDAPELASNKNAQNAILSWATLLIEAKCARSEFASDRDRLMAR